MPLSCSLSPRAGRGLGPAAQRWEGEGQMTVMSFLFVGSHDRRRDNPLRAARPTY